MVWGQERYTQIFTYDSPDRLKDLVAMLSDQSIKLSIGAVAVMPKEFEELRNEIERKTRCDAWGSRYLTDPEKMRPSIERLVAFAHEIKVLPFVTVHHHGYWPEISDKTPRIKDVDDEILPSSRNPRYLLEGWRFHSIWLKEARKKEGIKRFKDAAQNMPAGYEISSVSAGLNPREYGGGCDYSGVHTEFDAELDARGGKVTITWNKKPEDTSKAIPPQMLEGLVKLGFKPTPEALPEHVTA